ncbi:MAG: hypothetical protein LBH43_20690 [Treponema sp.]|jgi:hypothetical protein|nr:hypothetical protein [Treponema sp.]
MESGEILGNTTTAYPSSYGGGGGVFVAGNFTKTGGTIYGYTVGDGNSNAVNNSSGVAQSNQGHAVYVYSGAKRRETTAGPGVNLDSEVSGAAGGWEN